MTAELVYFLKDPHYVRHNARRDVLEPNFTRRIVDTWNNWPPRFASGVDAAVNFGGETATFNVSLPIV